jgi:hypothetical protein
MKRFQGVRAKGTVGPLDCADVEAGTSPCDSRARKARTLTGVAISLWTLPPAIRK